MKKRKDGRYCKAITLPNGKRKYFYSDEQNERRATKGINEQILSYKESTESNVLFSVVAAEWKAEHDKKISRSTRHTNESMYKMIVEYFGEMKISEITLKDVNRFADEIASKNFAKKHCSLILGKAKMIFKYAVMNEYIDSDPSIYAKIPNNLVDNKRNALTPEEIEKVKAYKDSEFGFFAYFLMHTGCRRGEALALKYSDVDLQKRKIVINKTLIFSGTTYLQNHTKTQSGMREIPIPSVLCEELRRRMASENDYIFQGKDGSYIRQADFASLWRRYKKLTGLNIVPHQLRHQFATFLYDAGVDVKSAQRILGHTDVSTTMNIYTHLSESKKEEAVNKIEKFFSE